MRTIFKTAAVLAALIVTGLVSYHLGRGWTPWGTAPQTSDHDQMDHSTMDHDQMDHSTMDHDQMDHSTMDHDQTGDSSSERKILYWQAPMNPAEIYDRPGKSAMGMDLVPVYADDVRSRDGNQIRIDPATVQNMGVRTAGAVLSDFSRTIRTVGKVEYNEESFYKVNTKFAGWVEGIFVGATGEFVEKGGPLLEIYSPELVNSQEEFLLALSAYERLSDSPSAALREDAATVLESSRERLRFWDMPPAEIDRLERTREVRRTMIIASPASGVVVAKSIVEGAHIKAGEDLYEIADLSKVWVHASLYDYEVPWVTEGQRGEMELAYLPGRTYSGTVSHVYPYLRDKARDVHVRLVFQNPDLSLKPGMYVNVEFETRSVRDALVIPTEAVLRTGQRALVFVDLGDGVYEPREIRIAGEGGEDNRFVRVLSGLTEGEEVVTSAQFMLDSESRLQEAIEKMLEGSAL
jgi:Cu(I)/Ag(I) efflux system membrane fusion protein/cobalt-zinc-cadmium efflux system membrane fusion protein